MWSAVAYKYCFGWATDQDPSLLFLFLPRLITLFSDAKDPTSRNASPSSAFSSTSMSKDLFRTLGVATPFDPDYSLVTSPVFSPLVLAILRLTFALYILIAVLVILIWDATKLHTADAYEPALRHAWKCAEFCALILTTDSSPISPHCPT